MKVSIQNVLIFFTTVFIHITNARYCPNLLYPYANWHQHNRILEGPKFKLDDGHNNYLIGNKYRKTSISNLKFSNKIFVNLQTKLHIVKTYPLQLTISEIGYDSILATILLMATMLQCGIPNVQSMMVHLRFASLDICVPIYGSTTTILEGK